MSGDFYHGGGGSTGSDGAINSGFDPLDAASTGEHGSSFSNNNDTHGVDQRAAYWKEYADRSFKEYFSNCPGGPASSAHGTGQAEQSNTEVGNDTAEEECIKPQEPSHNREQYLRYVFHLYVNEDVGSVKIVAEKRMLNGKLTIPLEPCSEDRKHWRSDPFFIHASENDSFRYRYAVKYNKGLMKTVAVAVANFLVGRKDEKPVQELHTRKLERGTHQYDIFHHPSDPSWMRTVVVGQVFFIKMLYRELDNGGNVNELLIECEHLGFGHPGYVVDDVKQHFLKWVQNVAGTFPTPYQAVFLCSLLGQLVERGRNWKAGHTCWFLGEKCCDLILSSFGRCPHSSLPQSSLKFIKVVAEDLFKTGSSTACLLFMKYFCSLLDVNYVMLIVNKLSSQPYTERQFNQDVPLLLESLAILSNRTSCARYLSFTIGCSPTVHCLWNLYNLTPGSFSDVLESLTKEVSNVYNTFISRSRIKPDLLDPVFWSLVPGNLKEKLSSHFCKALTDQILSETAAWSKDRLASLMAIATDVRLHSSDQFYRLVLGVMTHKCKEVVYILPDLLESTAFRSYWETTIPELDKKRVCIHWLKTAFGDGTNPKDKILGVVKACDLLCSTDAIKHNKALSEAICKEVESLVVIKTDFHSIVSALQDGQSLSPAIWQRLTSILRSAMQLHNGTGDRKLRYRKMIQMLGFDVHSQRKKNLLKTNLKRAEEEVLLVMLDDISLPAQQGHEQVFKAMISDSEVWIPVLSALHPLGTLTKHPKVLAATIALQQLTDPLGRSALPVAFFLGLRDEDLCLLANYCGLAFSPESDVAGKMQDELMMDFSKSRETAKTFWERFSNLEKTIYFLQAVTKDFVVISDAKSLVSEVNKRKEVKAAATLKSAVDDAFWGSLRCLIDSEKSIIRLQGSIIFANITRMCLREEFARSQTLSEDVTSVEEALQEFPQRAAAEILRLIGGKGLPKFKEACTNLFGTYEDLSVRDVNMLCNGIADKEALQRELTVINPCFPISVSPRKERMLLNYLHFPRVSVKVEQLMSVSAALGCGSENGDSVTQVLKDFISSTRTTEIKLSRLCEAVDNKTVATVDRTLDDNLTIIIKTLQESSELMSFMKETAGEDIRILIDAVEEHSDQFVSEAIVSDLIDVHGFVRSFFKEKPKDPLMLLDSLAKCYGKLEKKDDMAVKIRECGCNVHSLRGLYMNVANRGEMTKEIISNAVQKGCYVVKASSNGSCDVQLSYRRQKGDSKETSYNMAELHDLRSRALLIVNTDKKQEEQQQSEDCDATSTPVNAILSVFTQQVEMITDILNMVNLLRESGHPDFNEKFWRKLNSFEETESLANSLKGELKDWRDVLRVLQKEHYFLNFFHPDQLWILKKFLSRPLAKADLSLRETVHSLLRFVDPSIRHTDLHGFHHLYKAPKKTSGHESDLRAIGEVLDAIFAHRRAAKAKKAPQHSQQRAVKPGELFVAVLEENSKQTAHVVLSLFQRTTGSYPQPSQVLFCHSETSWEEVERLLKRAFEAFGHGSTVELHCLANVENLSNDMQFDLVDAIRDYQQRTEGLYLLSIVCCGGNHHHIADRFSSSAHNDTGMTDVELRNAFQKDFPDVFMVTSDLPGVGKTELIHERAALQGKKVVTIPISGPLSRKNLVKRLTGLQCAPYECIHFDVGEVDDPLALDTLMFELVVVGMVSCGTDIFHLPTRHVYIEIANTLRHWLQDSLPVTKCFFPLRVKWDGYKDLIVSQEPLSGIQVVCQYLDAFESGKLESKDLRPGDMKPLSPDRCKKLLSKYFSSSGDLSYNIVESFVKVFAIQLMQFSASPYFKPHNLSAVLGPSHDVRNCLFKALLEVSREFASRSVVTCKTVQAEAISKEKATEVLQKIQLHSKNVAVEMVKRVQGMIQWADNNHLVIVFHSLEALTISALYRDLSLVPTNVHELFKTQAVKGKKIDDFTKMNQKQLQNRLDLIVRTTPREKDDSLQKMEYALTPDNILKMVLIIQRIRAGIPVIVMGETGCGKTSLVRYLAKTCGVPFHVFNFHAGISEEQLVRFVHKMENEAESAKQVWVFLDEINTCDYLGTINEMMCHRSIKGKPLLSNVVFIAACNPYRLRPTGQITTAGLCGKTNTDEYSKLVYRVHPLPETMIDFVWDYGSLSKTDESAYISRMVEGLTGNVDSLLVDLLCTSQQYIREFEESPYCVSLRDVRRCIVLVRWFREILRKRNNLSLSRFKDGRQYQTLARGIPLRERSVVLALAHCYQSRLRTKESRKEYRRRLVDCFKEHHLSTFDQRILEAIVRAEQDDYLERMELPEGTAKNSALRENVFVMLVCILNRIPVFVVGKPGCSKSLSMQVIRSNLRGKDTKDSFLKTLPQLYVVSHQGSESSTSDGILKVFDKAKRYKKHNKSGDVLPVVLLDEIGLAEVSKYNPLKVLHSLLEPGDSIFPDVAVVGISNWALDAAKMNRAIHLSRPEPDVDDLFETGKSLREAGSDSGSSNFGVSCTRSGRLFGLGAYPDDTQLRCLAEAYQKYQLQQRYPNFHGLRDYYSLIKCLSTDLNGESTPLVSEEKTKEIQRALQRNFGGLPNDVNNFQRIFQERIQLLQVMDQNCQFPVTDLICDNLRDKRARHLMIITNGDSAIGIIDQTLQDLDKEKITIFGSRFEEDLSEEYNYRMLSRIILCMERDCVLILRDLESIYGSLYDMLNQNYTVVGGKRNCRVALGAFSNPMCQVHDGFRCVVLIDQGRVDFTDPPFLNRFEKQLLRFSDVLNEEQREVIKILKEWVRRISMIPDFKSHFHEEDMFIGFCDDTLPSLVLKNSRDPKLEGHEIVEECKRDLMMVASPDGVVRSLQSALAQTNLGEVKKLYYDYFQKPLHNGLRDYLRHSLECLELDCNGEDATKGMRLVIMTHSNIHVNVSQCLDGLVQCQTEKLSAFKSEKQLTKELEGFWGSSDSLLVLQCKPELDASHVLLAKSIIEQHRETYIKRTIDKNQRQVKHVCIVIHVQRESEANKAENQRWQFSFQSGWKQVTIDVLEDTVLPVTEFLDVSVMELLESKALSFEEVASEQFLWCFFRIKYPPSVQPPLDDILQLEGLLRSSPKILACFKELVNRWLAKRVAFDSHEEDRPTWQYFVACDRQALINSLHLVGAIQHHVSHLTRQPLAKIVYFLEKESAWPWFLLQQDTFHEDELQVWLQLIMDSNILNIDDIPDHQGAESYFISERPVKLKFPYFSVFYKNVEHVQSIFVEDQRQLLLDRTNLNENDELSDAVEGAQLHRFASLVKEKVPQVFELDYLRSRIECYVEDFLDMKSAHFSDLLTREERTDFLKSAMANHLKFPINGDPALLITQLHSLFWQNEPSYVAALQVFVTCYKSANVDLGPLVSEFTPLFEKMMFQDNNAGKNASSEDFQELERSHSFDEHHTEDVCAMMDGYEVDAGEVSSETFTTEKEGRLRKEQNDDEMKVVEDIGSQIEEGKEDGILTENQGVQEPKDEDATQTTGRNDSLKEDSESDVCEHESVGGENDVTVEREGNTELELKQAVEGNEQNDDNSNMTKDDAPSWRGKQENPVDDNNVDKNDKTSEEEISEPPITENLEENASNNDEWEEDGIVTITDDSGVEGSVNFNEVLLETLCSALLPTDEIVKNLKGPEGWQRTASLFLSTARRLQVQIPAFHYLRVCHDFVTLLVLPESLEPYSLYMLGALGKTGASEGYLDSPDTFYRITNVIDELEQRGVEKRRLEDFLMLFYGRCIDSNQDTPALGVILEKISFSGEKTLLRLAGPLLHRIFLTEENFRPGVFEDLLHSLDFINEHPGLQETSAALSTLSDDVELDSPFAVVCCDLISEVAFPEADLSTLSHSEDQILVNFRKAFQTLTEPCEDAENGLFHLICATAYLRSFLASFAKFILERRQCLTEDGEFTVLLNEINAVLSCNQTDLVSPRTAELKLYFIKELKKELYMWEVREVCQRSPKLPALKNLDWLDEDLVDKLSFDPLRNYSENSQAQAALATLLEKNDLKPLEGTILAMSSSAEKRIEMAATLAKSFYLVRSTRRLKDSEDKAIDSFIGKFGKFENPYVQLLLRITGRKDFKSKKLCISSESSPADVHRATLILHLCIVLASHFSGVEQKKLAFMSYLSSPLAASNTYVLASGEGCQQPYEIHRNYSFNETSFSLCSCRTFFVAASDDDGDETECPNCRSVCKAEKVPSKSTAAVEAIQPSKVPVCLTCPQDLSIHVRQMDPREFRVLHLFVHAALYGGYAMELFDENTLTQILGNAVTESDPCEVCFQQIDNDLRALCSLLDAKEEYVIGFLHFALLKSISILTSGSLCQTEGERLAWEKTFSETVRPLLREFYPRKRLASLQDFMSKSTVAVQRRIEEIDDPQFSNTAERNLHLPRLLRVTLPKTFSSLKAYYMSADHNTKNHHPLLGLFLDFNDSLPNVASLHDLLSWSRIVDSLLSRRLSRHEATTNIEDIIRKESKSVEERKRLSEIFEKFSMAWEKMRPFVMDRLKQDVPYLSESSPISFCLIKKRGQGACLCAAMEILREIQNDFLQKMLSIASTGKCSALVFLEREKGKFTIPVVHLQDAREKEIIQYQWTDEILRHSQRNTEYGHGREIFFDLAKIEKEMAARFLVGKSYLSTFEGLQEFIFARELFHTCRGILDDLQDLIPQQPLTEVFRSSLFRQCESLKNVQDLLEHMEIVLCLLKRHRVGKPEDPLTEFTANWLRGPRPFPKDLLPQPHRAIQLRHVVALYEFLEDRLAESAAKRVHDMYRVPILEETIKEMTKGISASGTTESHRSVLNAITVALKRFIYRYLSSEEMKPEPADSLKERMQERSLWPIDAFQSWNPKVESASKFIGDVFPEKLAIKHTYEVLRFYQDRLKMLEEAKKVPRNPAPKISRPSVSRSRQLKTQKLFSNF